MPDTARPIRSVRRLVALGATVVTAATVGAFSGPAASAYPVAETTRVPRWIQVKYVFALHVTSTEKSALSSTADTC